MPITHLSILRPAGRSKRSATVTCSNLALAVLLIFAGSLRAQLSTPNYTGCPNQIITVNVQWPNVAITNLSLSIPAGGSALNNGNLQSNTTFTISHPGPATTNWTLSGTGTGASGPVTSTIVFQVSITAPAPLTFVHQSGTSDYCPGSTANITTDQGGNYYTVNGPQNLGTFQTNVFVIPNLGAGHSGTYQVTSVGTCTRTGVFALNVAPNTPLTVNNASNVCEGDPFTLQASMPTTTQNWVWEHLSSQTTYPGFSSSAFGSASSAHDGVWRVTVDQGFGTIFCPRSATTQINVVEMHPVSASASPSGVLCQNDKLSLSASTGQGAAGYSWVGPCNFGPVAVSNPTISPVIPCNTGIYTVTAFFTNNAITCPVTNTVNVEVVGTSAPIPNVPISVCQNDNVQLSATGGTNVSNWIWYGPNFSSTVKDPYMSNVQPSNSGPYVVTAVYYSSANTKSCAVSSQPQQLTVIQVNSVSVIPPPQVCEPENALLAASAPGAVAYNWKGPNNQNYNGANVTLYYPTTSYSGIYTVTAFFGSLLCPNENTVSLKVNPVLNFTLIPRQQVCYNSPVQITGPAGADSYSWTSSTGIEASTKDLKFNSILPQDAGHYTLTVAKGPCISKASSEIVVLNPISFTLSPKSRTICRGDTVVFEAGVTGGSENYAYTWNPSVGMDSPTGPYKVLVPLYSSDYNLMVHDIACPNFTLGYQFKVEVKQPPTPTLNLTANRGCVPFTQFFSTGTEGEAFLTTFNFGGLNQFQRDNFVYTFKEPGTYTVQVVSQGTNGCSGTWEYPIPIVVDPKPGSDIIWEPQPATTSGDVTFHATSTSESVYHSWHFVGGVPANPDTSYIGGGSDTTSDDRPVRIYEKPGRYPVMLLTTNEYGCSDTVVKFIQVQDIMNVFIPNAFTPNGDGVNDGFSMKGQGLEAEGFTMDIFTRKGQLVYSTNDIADSWDGTYEGRPCSNGVYAYKIRAVGMNGEGRKEFVGHVVLIR